MSGFVLDTNTLLANSLLLDGVGNQLLSPALREVIAVNKIARNTAATLATQRDSTTRLRDVSASLESMCQEIRQSDADLRQGLNAGFSALDASIQNATNGIVSALYEVNRNNLEAIQRLGDRIIANQIAIGNRLSQQLSEISHKLSHRAELEAEEHFWVGMRFFFNQDLPRAHDQFQKSRTTYGGSFSVLLADGICCRMLGNTASARDALEAALSQTSHNPDEARRQRAIAALYLGRLHFDAASYDEAKQRYDQAWQGDHELCAAFVEGAACLLLSPTTASSSEVGPWIKEQFHDLFGKRSCQMWYFLALTLIRVAPDFAKEAFRHGAGGDHWTVEARDRKSLLALLKSLSASNAPLLVSAMSDEFPWLIN